MEIKIEVGEERFRDVLEKELNAFTPEELHKICEQALLKQMSDPELFKQLFVSKDEYYDRENWHANDILKECARKIDFSETFKEIQDGIVNHIKENFKEILNKIAVTMFIEGLSRAVSYSNEFRDTLNMELSNHLINNHNQTR